MPPRRGDCTSHCPPTIGADVGYPRCGAVPQVYPPKGPPPPLPPAGPRPRPKPKPRPPPTRPRPNGPQPVPPRRNTVAGTEHVSSDSTRRPRFLCAFVAHPRHVHRHVHRHYEAEGYRILSVSHIFSYSLHLLLQNFASNSSIREHISTTSICTFQTRGPLLRTWLNIQDGHIVPDHRRRRVPSTS